MSCRTTRKSTRVERREKIGVRGRFGLETLLRFLWEKRGKADGIVKTGWFEYFLRVLWATGVVPHFLTPDPGRIKAEEYCLLGCQTQRKGVLWIC